jgi:hypothetical protein
MSLEALEWSKPKVSSVRSSAARNGQSSKCTAIGKEYIGAGYVTIFVRATSGP